VARCGKYILSTAKEHFQLIWRAVESNYFPQLRSVFYKAVRCGKCILSAANRGFPKESRAGESGKRAVGRGVFHGPLLQEAGITCVISTYERNDEVITPTSEQIQGMR
jgi:hypothetical protein